MFNWQKLKERKGSNPILVLAPMADVTDPAFRKLIAKYGKPDCMWTEFVSADGLLMGGFEALIKDLRFGESERPIIAQFFTSKPEMMEKASSLASDLGFDGVDINMGCPDKTIEKQGAGASLIKNPELAKEIILAAKKGSKGLPVSVKTRIGYNKDELFSWLPHLLSVRPDLITLHARTRKEMSLVPADWNKVKEAVLIRNQIQSSMKKEDRTLIFGNGDVVSLHQAKNLFEDTFCDGIMIGKGIFGNPWFFSDNKPDSIKSRLYVLSEHIKLFEDLCGHKSFSIMKKHYKAYIKDFDGAKELRGFLMEAGNANEAKEIIDKFCKNIII